MHGLGSLTTQVAYAPSFLLHLPCCGGLTHAHYIIITIHTFERSIGFPGFKILWGLCTVLRKHVYLFFLRTAQRNNLLSVLNLNASNHNPHGSARPLTPHTPSSTTLPTNRLELDYTSSPTPQNSMKSRRFNKTLKRYGGTPFVGWACPTTAATTP